MNFPSPKEVHNKHFPDERFSLSVRYRVNEDGHEHDPDNYIGGIPSNTPFLTINLKSGGWSNDTWDRMEEAYQNEGYETYLKKSSGTTKTRSGTAKHAPTQLFVW